MLDLTKILNVGDKVYSSVFGEGTIFRIEQEEASYPIHVSYEEDIETFTKEGRLFEDYKKGECVLFPSKEVRTWENYCRFKKGDICLFWDGPSSTRTVGIFHSSNDKYRSGYFIDGALDIACFWENCELYKPEEYGF